MTDGSFDNVRECRYTVPGYWDIGEVYERLIEDIYEDENVIDGIWEIYHSWIDSLESDAARIISTPILTVRIM